MFKLLQGQNFALIGLDDEASVENAVKIMREFGFGNMLSSSGALIWNFVTALEFVQKLDEDRSELMWQTEVNRFMVECVTSGWDPVLSEKPNASSKGLPVECKCKGTILTQEELKMDQWVQERLAKMPKLAPVYALAVVKGYQLVNE